MVIIKPWLRARRRQLPKSRTILACMAIATGIRNSVIERGLFQGLL
jgi:hypothetical protein